MDLLLPLAIIAFAGLIHASFQLGVSVLTLLSGHSLSRQHSHLRTVRLTGSFVWGVATSTVLLLSFVALLLLSLTPLYHAGLLWTIGACLLIAVGIGVWLFYYRDGPGTSLWVPRSMASFLEERTKKTARSAEAFSLGVSSVLGEIIFLVAPLLISALAIISLPLAWVVPGILLYSVVSLLPLIVVWMLVGGGHTLGAIQRWREQHKGFLQAIAATGLVVLGFFVFVNEALVAGSGLS